MYIIYTLYLYFVYRINLFFLKLNLYTTVSRILTELKEENWILPVVLSVAIDLRRFAHGLDSTVTETSNSGIAKSASGNRMHGRRMETAAQSILKLFQICASDRSVSAIIFLLLCSQNSLIPLSSLQLGCVMVNLPNGTNSTHRFLVIFPMSLAAFLVGSLIGRRFGYFR